MVTHTHTHTHIRYSYKPRNKKEITSYRGGGGGGGSVTRSSDRLSNIGFSKTPKPQLKSHELKSQLRSYELKAQLKSHEQKPQLKSHELKPQLRTSASAETKRYPKSTSISTLKLEVEHPETAPNNNSVSNVSSKNNNKRGLGLGDMFAVPVSPTLSLSPPDAAVVKEKISDVGDEVSI